MSLYLYIIPIYNTVSYLNQYIESIINQSYENLEFLINLKISQLIYHHKHQGIRIVKNYFLHDSNRNYSVMYVLN